MQDNLLRAQDLGLFRLPYDADGSSLFARDAIGTVIFTAAAAISVVFGGLRIAFAALSIVLFLLGCITFLWAYARAIERSRTEEVSVLGIYGLAAPIPGGIRWRFHMLTAVQVVVSIIAASMRPFTAQAFGILVPMFGLGLGGLWAAMHGTFEPRAPLRRRRRPEPIPEPAERSTDDG